MTNQEGRKQQEQEERRGKLYHFFQQVGHSFWRCSFLSIQGDQQIRIQGIIGEIRLFFNELFYQRFQRGSFFLRREIFFGQFLHNPHDDQFGCEGETTTASKNERTTIKSIRRCVATCFSNWSAISFMISSKGTLSGTRANSTKVYTTVPD